MRTFLGRLIPRQPGYPVEVGIVTGEVGETMGLHDRDDQGVAGEELSCWLARVAASTRGGVMATAWMPRSGICAMAWT